MSVSTVTERILVALQETDSDHGIPVTAVAETVRSGEQLSQQVQITLAIEELTEEGMIDRETERDQVKLTTKGNQKATTTATALREQSVTVVEGSERREITLGTLADELDRDMASLAADCSVDGEYYLDEQRSSDIINREQELGELTTVVEESRGAGTGKGVFLCGPSGSGKTTVADMFLETIDVETLTTRCQGTDPYQPIRALLSQLGTEDPFAEALSETTDATDYGAQQRALFHEATALLSPDSGIRVLLVDELHLADTATWEYLDYLLERLEQHPLVLVGCYQSAALPEEAPLATEDIFERPSVTRLSLEGFETTETKQLIKQVVNEPGVPTQLASVIQSWTDGHPQFIISTIEALIDGGELDTAYRWYPESVDEIELSGEISSAVSRQLDVLDTADREILEWIGLHEQAVPFEVLEAVCPVPDDRIRATIDLLVDTDILAADQQAVSFRSTITREVVLENLDDEQLAQRHRHIAESLVEHLDAGRDESGGRQAAIATHYERAGQPEDAIPWYRRAADRAKELYARKVAITQYERTLFLAREHDSGPVFDLLEELAKQHHMLGEYDEATRRYQYITDNADDETRVRASFHKRGAIQRTKGNYDRALELIEDGLDMRRDARDLVQCELLNTKAYVLLQTGNSDEARELFEAQRTIGSELGDKETIAAAIGDLGVLNAKRGDLDKAEQLLEKATEKHEELRNDKEVVDLLNNMGLVQWKAGRLSEATQTLETSYQRQDEMRYRVGQSATMTNLGVIAEARNNLGDALEWYEQSLALNQKLGDKQGITILLGNLAIVHLLRGEFDQAWSDTERAIEQAQEIGDRASLAAAWNTRSEIHRYRGELSAAREAAVDATEIAEEIEDRQRRSTALYNDGRTAFEEGQYEHARNRFQDGLTLARKGGLDKQARQNGAGLVDIHVQLNTPEEVSDEAVNLERDEPLVVETVARARYEAALGETDQAWERLSSYLDTVNEDSRQIEALKLHDALARVADQRGDHEQAQHHASCCLERATEIGATLFAARSRGYLN